MVVKTFRGLLADGGQDHIRLQTNDGKVGYRVTKFQIMGPNANIDIEVVIKIYKDKQTTITTDIDFSDSNLLAAATINDSQDRHYAPPPIVIFDNEVFNQDIYITNDGHDNPTSVNYYIELEVIPLTSANAEYTTIKDIRGRNTT